MKIFGLFELIEGHVDPCLHQWFGFLPRILYPSPREILQKLVRQQTQEKGIALLISMTYWTSAIFASHVADELSETAEEMGNLRLFRSHNAILKIGPQRVDHPPNPSIESAIEFQPRPFLSLLVVHPSPTRPSVAQICPSSAPHS